MTGIEAIAELFDSEGPDVALDQPVGDDAKPPPGGLEIERHQAVPALPDDVAGHQRKHGHNHQRKYHWQYEGLNCGDDGVNIHF